MSKFKVGDKIKAATAEALLSHNLVYTVSELFANNTFRIEGNNYAVYAEDNYEKVGRDSRETKVKTHATNVQQRKRGTIYRFKTKAIDFSEIEISRSSPVVVVAKENDTEHSYVMVHDSLTLRSTTSCPATEKLTTTTQDCWVYLVPKNEVKAVVKWAKDVYRAPWDTDEQEVSVLTINMHS